MTRADWPYLELMGIVDAAYEQPKVLPLGQKMLDPVGPTFEIKLLLGAARSRTPALHPHQPSSNTHPPLPPDC